MYVCVCMYVRMYVCMYVCVYVCTYVCMYVCMYVRVCASVCLYAHVCMCVYLCVHVCVCVCVCAHACMYVCVPVEFRTHLEGDLRGESELVTLKQPSGGVHEHRVRDAVDQVGHSLLHVLGGLGTLNGLVEHNTKCL